MFMWWSDIMNVPPQLWMLVRRDVSNRKNGDLRTLPVITSPVLKSETKKASYDETFNGGSCSYICVNGRYERCHFNRTQRQRGPRFGLAPSCDGMGHVACSGEPHDLEQSCGYGERGNGLRPKFDHDDIANFRHDSSKHLWCWLSLQYDPACDPIASNRGIRSNP